MLMAGDSRMRYHYFKPSTSFGHMDLVIGLDLLLLLARFYHGEAAILFRPATERLPLAW
jgi:hypothetical protein